MAPERLVVVGDDGDITEVLAGPQHVHVLQGGVSVARQPETQHLHLVGALLFQRGSYWTLLDKKITNKSAIFGDGSYR